MTNLQEDLVKYSYTYHIHVQTFQGYCFDLLLVPDSQSHVGLRCFLSVV